MEITDKKEITSLSEAQKIIVHQSKENVQLKEQIDLLNEKVEKLQRLVFGASSEKYAQTDELINLPLFQQSNTESEFNETSTKESYIPAYTRKKGGRKKLSSDLPRIEEIIDLEESEKQCGCGHTKTKMSDTVSEKLDVIPAVVRVKKTIRPQYVCRSCESISDGSTPSSIAVAPLPESIIPKCMVTEGTLAHIMVSKFVDALPFYRQVEILNRHGVEISRATLTNWTMKISEKLQTLYDTLHQTILESPIINMDETTLQVLKEVGKSPTTKSYMWVIRGVHGVLFHYSPTRNAKNIGLLLKDYTGVVQTDDYAAYKSIDRDPDISLAGCLAHVRRKFFDAQKNGSLQATEALGLIRQIYLVEKEIKEKQLSKNKTLELREKKSRPLLNQLKSWLDQKVDETPPKRSLGKAIHYALKMWDRLLVYLKHPFMGPDNNPAENAIRPFVIGRKNWLFNDSSKGAKASATLYSFVESAKMNSLNPYEYLKYLFIQLPKIKEEHLNQLLPQNIDPKLLKN